MKSRLFAVALLAALGTASAQAQIKEVVAKAPITVTDKAGVKTAILKKFRIGMLGGERVGESQVGLFCMTQGQYTVTENFVKASNGAMLRAFRGEMTKAGYPKLPGAESLFENQQRQPADFDVGALLKNVKMYSCNRSGDISGAAYVEIKWELFSPRTQRVVFETTTEGSYQHSAGERITITELVERAMAAATRNLLAEPKLAELMTGGGEEAAVAAAPQAEFPIRRGRAFDGGVAKNSTLLRAAVVTVDSGFGTGSGFYISADGHLLTNQHVVGDVKFVKVRLATNREVVGEVLKTDRARDIALIKTEPIALQPLPARNSDPNVGEDVFAIGSPLGDTFSGSLTRGVLSGFRTMNEQRYLQSDVSILPGSSGGPLLDGSGAVIGITVSGVDAGRANLNFFVPIQEALSKFAIVFRD